jgi:CHAT domain-containing protein
VNLPSASTLAVLRQDLRGRRPAAKTLAVLADPVFRREDPRVAGAGRPAAAQMAQSRRGLPPRGAGAGAGADHGRAGIDTLGLDRLPFSKDEADAIAHLIPDPGQKLEALGFDASVATATSGQLADFRYVHFATHGVLDTSQPELSLLVLSQIDRNGKSLDGSLRLKDIYNLKLDADLVVLSACQTALGKEVRGEGLIGLTRGFMYAGAARVLASLWSVEDRPTSILMEKLYRYLLVDRLSPAESLRRAQLDLASNPRWASPTYWAGFSLQGEWK